MMKTKRKAKTKSVWNDCINSLAEPVIINFSVPRRLDECAAQFEYYEAYNWQHAIKTPGIIQPIETAIIQQEDGSYAFRITQRNMGSSVFSNSSIEARGYLRYRGENYTYVKGQVRFYFESINNTYLAMMLSMIFLAIISLVDISHNFPLLFVPVIGIALVAMEISERLQNRNRLAEMVELTLKKKHTVFQIIAKGQ